MLPGNMVFTVISWRRSGIRKPPPEATRPPGEGVEQDERQAVVWIRKAAEQGYEDAFYTLGRL